MAAPLALPGSTFDAHLRSGAAAMTALSQTSSLELVALPFQSITPLLETPADAALASVEATAPAAQIETAVTNDAAAPLITPRAASRMLARQLRGVARLNTPQGRRAGSPRGSSSAIGKPARGSGKAAAGKASGGKKTAGGKAAVGGRAAARAARGVRLPSAQAWIVTRSRSSARVARPANAAPKSGRKQLRKA